MGKKGSSENQMRIVVCDAGPIIHLHEAGILSLLKHGGEVFLPHSVLREVLLVTDLADHWPEWLRVVQLSSSELKEAEMWAKTGDLHVGEAKAFVLARMQKADWLLTDDSGARLFASLLGLEVHGSLGIVLWNVAKGYLARREAEQALSNLEKSSLWLSSKIFEEARNALIDMTS
jgi:predicted nucleic acid-binding protein